MEILKSLLSNKVNKANTDKGETKKKQKGESHRIHPNGVEVYRWLLRNGTNKTDIDGVKTKVLLKCQRSGGPRDPLLVPQVLQTSPVYFPQFRKIFKSLKAEITMKNMTNCFVSG